MESKIQIPSLDDHRVLRHVKIKSPTIGGTDYRLLTWDTGRRFSTGQWKIGYAFWRDGEDDPIFVGEDCGVSPMHSIDSDDALRGLLGFLTLRPGDTDADYFAEYTPRQLSFAEGDAEYLSLYAMEASDDLSGDPFAFVEIEG